MAATLSARRITRKHCERRKSQKPSFTASSLCPSRPALGATRAANTLSFNSQPTLVANISTQLPFLSSIRHSRPSATNCGRSTSWPTILRSAWPIPISAALRSSWQIYPMQQLTRPATAPAITRRKRDEATSMYQELRCYTELGNSRMTRFTFFFKPFERRIAVCCAILVALACIATAAARPEIPAKYKKWLQQDVAYIITNEEKKSFV